MDVHNLAAATAIQSAAKFRNASDIPVATRGPYPRLSRNVLANEYGIFLRMKKLTTGDWPVLRRWIPLLWYVLAACAASPCAAEIPPLDIRVVSAKEVVFDWKHDRCDDQDIPDTALTAFRRADGQIVGLATHWRNRLFLIAQDHSFKRDCRIVYEGNRNPDPAAFDDKTWIAAPWTDDGRTVYALGHNEYQANSHSGRCAFKSYAECWYNSIVLVESTNGGMSFAKNPGSNLVVSAAYPFETAGGAPRGFFGPTNVLKVDSYFYTIIYTTGGRGQPPGHCLFRSRQFQDPSSWEYWTDKGFYRSSSNPYRDAVSQRPACAPLHGLVGRVRSIRRHRPSGLFLATIEGPPRGTSNGYIAVSISSDLRHWSTPPPLISISHFSSTNCDDAARYAYPSLIDFDSPELNFSDVGAYAALYLTEMKIVRCGSSPQRNLIRYNISISVQSQMQR